MISEAQLESSKHVACGIRWEILSSMSGTLQGKPARLDTDGTIDHLREVLPCVLGFSQPGCLVEVKLVTFSKSKCSHKAEASRLFSSSLGSHIVSLSLYYIDGSSHKPIQIQGKETYTSLSMGGIP
jgi:hypothetical protein